MVKAICFEGGGILGAGQPSMLRALEDRKVYNPSEYTIFSGTSIGALNALMYALKLTTNQIIDVWKHAEEKKIMPKKRFSFTGKRINLLKEFVEERILKVHGFPQDLTTKQLYEKFGNEFYSVAYVLQENKGVIFGHNQHDVRVSQAVKYSVSHPLKFDTNVYEYNGKKYDLSDGGIIANCPVAVIGDRNDLDNIICLSVTESGSVAYKRVEGYIEVLKKIVEGTVSRNEFMTYAYANQRWGDKFQLWNVKLDKEVDIFDVSAIPYVMKSSYDSTINGSTTKVDMFIQPQTGIGAKSMTSGMFLK